MKKTQTGFTLIELAIVLVIIGLLLGGVLKGQELINSAKVKNIVSDFKNTQVYIYGYQDKYKSVPGDDHAANTHVAGQNAAVGTQNGVIEGNWLAPANNAEACVFWQHVRLADLAAGKTAAGDINCANGNDYMPKNAEGGVTGVQGVADFNANVIGGLRGSFVVCSSQIRGSFAKQIDTALDDGDTALGSVRVYKTGAAAWAATAAITGDEDSAPYNVCLAF